MVVKLPWRDPPLALNGKVVRSLRIKGSTSFEIACQFSKLAPGEVEEITKIVHLYEREQRLHYLLESNGYE